MEAEDSRRPATEKSRWQTVRDGSLQGRRLVAVFDVAAGDAHERTLLPTWGSLAIFYGEAEPDGMPSPAAAAQLEALERRLHTLLETHGSAREVGMITTNGRRELVIYTAAADDLRQVARTLQDEFSELELQLTLMSDREWTVFRQFVPGDR